MVLIWVGLLFSAGIYLVTMSLWAMKQSDYDDETMLSLYFALGIFLLTAESGVESQSDRLHLLVELGACRGDGRVAIAGEREDLIAAAVLVAIGVILTCWLRPRAAGREGVGGARVSGRSVRRCLWRE